MLVVATVYGVMASALVARRWRPLETGAFIAVVFSAANVALGSSQSVGRLLPALVAGYSIGCHEQGRRAYVGLGVITSALVIHEAFDPTLTGWSDYAGARPVAPAVVGRRRAWFVGAYIRARRQLMEELHGRADHAALEEHNRIARELHDVVAHGPAGTRGFRVEAVLPIEVSV